MAGCEHIAWLQSANTKELQFRDGGRMKQVIREMPNPIAQYPSLIFFIGQKAKNIALRELFPYNNIKRGHRDGFANLRIDNATIRSDRPIWFADSDPLLRITPSSAAATCHESSTYPARWVPSSEYSTFDVVHARLFFLFTDVICIFADDFNGLESIAERLVAWAAIGSASNLPGLTRPRVIVITSADSSSSTHNVLETEDFRFNLRQHSHQTILNSFSSITLFYLPGDHLSQLAQHRGLRENLLKQAEEMRDIRASSQNLFSAVHLCHLYEQAMLHTTETITQQFSFLLAAQGLNTILVDLKDHLMIFMELGARFKLPYNALASHIASSLLMNAYPPGMHRELLTDPSALLTVDWMLYIDCV